MKLMLFVSSIFFVLWLIDYIIHQMVEILLKAGWVIRSIAVIIILLFLLGVYIDPVRMGEIAASLWDIAWFIGGWLFEFFSDLVTFFMER